MDDPPQGVEPPASPNGQPVKPGPVKPDPSSRPVSVQFGPSRSIPGSRLKGRGK
jgi:hypothetical protein